MKMKVKKKLFTTDLLNILSATHIPMNMRPITSIIGSISVFMSLVPEVFLLLSWVPIFLKFCVSYKKKEDIINNNVTHTQVEVRKVKK